MERVVKRVATFRLLCFGLISLGGLAAGCNKESAAPKSAALLGLSAHFVDANHRPVDDPSAPGYSRSHLRIQGQVYKDGAPVNQGAVNVTIVSTTYKFNQSMFFPLDDHGNFVSPDDALTSIHPGSEVTITAELTSSAGRESRTIELDSESPAKKWVAALIILGVLGGMIAIFLFAFTGHTRAGKNRLAIQFSYLVILIFLAVPIVAPVLLLRVFPAAIDAMIGYPAGLVVTRIGEPPHDNAQWAINIGGYSHVCVDLCLDRATLPEQDAVAKSKANAQVAALQAASVKKNIPQTGFAPNSAPKPADQKTPRTTSSPVGSKTQSPAPARKTAAPETTLPPGSTIVPAATQLPASSAPVTSITINQPAADTDGGAVGTVDAVTTSDNGGVAARDNSPRAEPNLTDDLIHPERLDPPIVKVQGGLVIPLYVIVLSVIGGAINMTRKVPGFQKEGEDSPTSRDLARTQYQEPEPSSPAHQTTDAAESGSAEPAADKAADDKADVQTSAAKLSMEDQAAQIDHDLDTMIPAQVQRKTDTAAAVPKMQALVTQMQNLFATKTNPALRGYSNFDEWYVSRPRLREILGGSWRVELLNQYMYLISAPFLAIVTYYILDLLGVSKPGVIVVLSFSVGLISEKIVNWILGIAAGYMQTPKT